MSFVQPDVDVVFKALADPTRRFLLDRLHEDNGQTLGRLCEQVDMTRQAATQHLTLLEAANLVTTVRRGREKLHYLNPVPLQDIQERWIDKFERPRLRTLSAVKRRAKRKRRPMSEKPSYVYVTYIESHPRAGVGGPDRRRRDRALLGSPQRGRQLGRRQPWAHVRPDGSGDDGEGAPSWRATRRTAWSSTGARWTRRTRTCPGSPSPSSPTARSCG